MDFFEHRRKAQERSSLLLWLFAATVLAILLLLNTIVFILLGETVPPSAAESSALIANGTVTLFGARSPLDPLLFTTLVTGGLIGIGSFSKVIQLRSGGGAQVATLLGGREIPPGTHEAPERVVLNVVEEMAIATGTPVPPVYLIREPGINAFAAGYAERDAVIGITEGAVSALSRDELQGVIAHEFSHILHGDMRINIRLIGLLQGLLIISLLGRFLLRSGLSSHTRSFRRRNSGDSSFIFVVGGALLLVGWIGVLGGRLIKAAVSRQREFLADASAVQYTRNPDGIAGALKKIGGFTPSPAAGRGSTVRHPRAEENSHLFFGNALGSTWFPLFATHPPLEVRIQRIDPSFQPSVQKASASLSTSDALDFQLTHSIGAFSANHLEHAKAVSAAIPASRRDDLHSHGGAEAVLLALLTSPHQEVRGRQHQALEQHGSPALVRLYHSSLRSLQAEPIPPEAVLPTVDISLGVLRTLSRPEREQFLTVMRAFVLADGEVHLFEYMLHRMVEAMLESSVPGATREAPLSEEDLRSATQELFSVASHLASSREAASALFRSAFQHVLHASGLPGSERAPLDTAGRELELLDGALPRLQRASFPQKKAILEGLELIILHDNEVSKTEAELFRTIAATLGCPVPPILSAPTRLKN
ncbi:M48 family metallopeptidase [bacterium]|nr:M48 family metallopeptidase [bacterium]